MTNCPNTHPAGTTTCDWCEGYATAQEDSAKQESIELDETNDVVVCLKRPVELEARRVTGDLEKVAKWCDGEVIYNTDPSLTKIQIWGREEDILVAKLDEIIVECDDGEWEVVSEYLFERLYSVIKKSTE